MSKQEWSKEAKEKYGNYAPRSVYDPNWIDPFTVPDLAQYWRNLRKKFGRINFLGLSVIVDSKDLPLQSMWVSPALSEEKINVETDKDWEKKITDMWEVINYNPKLIILGDPGSGKSTIVQALCYLISLKEQPVSAPALQGMIPIPVILREEEFKTFKTVEEFWESFLLLPFAQDLTRERAEQLGKLGQLFFVFDGIDELGSLSRRIEVRDVFWALMDRYPQCRFLGTSRIVGFEQANYSEQLRGESEFQSAWRVLSEQRSFDGFEESEAEVKRRTPASQNRYRKLASVYYVAPISNDRLSIFSSKWHKLRESSEEDAKAFVKSVKSKPSLDDLVRNPSFLLMALLVHFNAKTLPDGRAELYEKISEAYLERIHSFKKISISESISLNLRQKMRILSVIGYRMMLNRSPIDLRQPDALVKNETRVDRDNLLKWLQKGIDEEGVEGCSAKQLLHFLSDRAGLLLPSGSGEDQLYEWPHLSFKEYFASVYLRDNLFEFLLTQGPGDSPESTTSLHLQVMVDREPWRETLLFLAEQLDAKKTDQLLSCVVTDHDDAHVFLASVLLNQVVSLAAEKRSQWFSVLVNNSKKFSDFEKQSGWRLFAEGFSPEALIEQLVKKGQGITKLDLSVTSVEDITPLKEIKGLTTLYLSGTGVKDITPLKEIKGLNTLDLGGTGVKDITPLKEIEGLKTLMLSGTSVEDIANLKKIEGLTTLFLWNINFEDLTPLKEIKGLTTLNLHGTSVKDITPLKEIKGLTTLYLRATSVIDITPLKEIKGLTALYLGHIIVEDITPLKEVKGLTTLEIWGTVVKDITPLKEVKGLNTLYLSGEDVKDITPLKEMKGLTTLEIWGIGVEDITLLKEVKGLTTLSLRGTSAEDITPLQEFQGLTTLYLRDMIIKDITPLREIKGLTTLDLRGTNVKDVSWLENRVGIIQVNNLRFVCGLAE
jgi:Leucine-rich repeat (LRR) protein